MICFSAHYARQLCHYGVPGMALDLGTQMARGPALGELMWQVGKVDRKQVNKRDWVRAVQKTVRGAVMRTLLGR